MESKMLFNYFSRVYESLKIWAQVYEITNPIKESALKNEKRIMKLYEWLVLLNFVLLMIWAYKGAVDIFGSKILIIIICFGIACITLGLLAFIAVGFGFTLRCCTITGYKSIWLFIIAFFIPQIFCAVCSTIYIGL